MKTFDGYSLHRLAIAILPFISNADCQDRANPISFNADDMGMI